MKTADDVFCRECKRRDAICFRVDQSRLADSLGIARYRCDRCGAEFVVKADEDAEKLPVVHHRRRSTRRA